MWRHSVALPDGCRGPHRIASHCDMAKKPSRRLAIVASIGAMDGPLDSFVIGQVLYSLGRDLGHRLGAAAPLGCTHLLQEDRAEMPLHACLSSSSIAVRLLEFQRTSRTVLQERRKRQVLQAALSRQADLAKLSRQVHWYVAPLVVPSRDVPGGKDIGFQALPYLDHLGSAAPRLRLESLVQGIVADVFSEQVPRAPALLAAYLEAVARFAGRPGVASTMVVAVSERGGIRWAMLEDVRHLRHSPRQLRSLGRPVRREATPRTSASAAAATGDRKLEAGGMTWPN